MHTRSKKSLMVLFSFLLLVVPALVRAQKMSAKQTVAADSMVSVDFKECGRAVAQSPTSFNANPDDMAKLLNGVWLGTRILKTGTAPMANYMMVYDVQAKEALIYEERGASIKENAFAKQFSAPAANAPTVTYFYCGSPKLEAFKDVFVKVSDVPRLNEMDKTMGISATDASLSKVWEALRESGEFAKARTTTQLNTAFYTMAVNPSKTTGRRNQDIRLDLAGQLRGSPNKSLEYSKSQPVAGIESGVFQGVTTSNGNYYVSSRSYAVLCYGTNSPVMKIEADTPPLTSFRYTKVVIGPLGN